MKKATSKVPKNGNAIKAKERFVAEGTGLKITPPNKKNITKK